MLKLTISGKEYKIKFGYNSFCDTDLMDKTSDLLKLFTDNGVKTDDDVFGLNKIKDLFVLVRDLIYTGMMKYNPVQNEQEVGELLDTYREEAPEGEKRELLDLFSLLADELINEGFFGGLMKVAAENLNAILKKRK